MSVIYLPLKEERTNPHWRWYGLCVTLRLNLMLKYVTKRANCSLETTRMSLFYIIHVPCIFFKLCIIINKCPMNNIKVYITAWAGELSRYSNWLRSGRSGDRIPVRARFSPPVQTGPGAHPASCTMGTGSFPGIKSGQGVTLTPHPLLVLLVMKE